MNGNLVRQITELKVFVIDFCGEKHHHLLFRKAFDPGVEKIILPGVEKIIVSLESMFVLNLAIQ